MSATRPYDHRGHFVPLDCPSKDCGNGKLQSEGQGVWRCDGLADPNDASKELDACNFTHFDGEPYRGSNS